MIVRIVRFRGETADAFTYVAVPEADPGQPSPSYINQITTGAKAHGIPEEYINSIKAFVAAQAA